MPSRIPATLFALALAISPVSIAAAGAAADPITIGVVMPRGLIGQGADISAPLRETLIGDLRGASAQVVALDATDDSQVATEAAQKKCAYVLYTRASQTRGGARGGLMHKMSMLVPQKPSTAASPYAAPTAGDTASLSSAEKIVVKGGDTVSLEYRLMSRGAVVSSGKLEGRAQADGEDVLSPLVAQLSGAVIGAASGGGNDRGAAPTAATAAPPSPADGSGGGSRRANRTISPNAGPPPTMNCEQMAANSHGAVTVEACKQMMGAQQAYTAAAADPSASRPGDDKMGCDQIAAEIKQQPFTPADKGKLVEAQTASSDVQKTLAQDQKEMTALAAKQSAEELARTPLSQLEPNALAAKEQEKRDAEQKAQRDRMEAEMKPKAERQMTSTADLMSDVGKQISDNPRLARLMQLALQKGCKVR